MKPRRKTPAIPRVPALRHSVKLHSPSICTRTILRDFFYARLVHSKWRVIYGPAKAYVRSRVKKATAYENASPYFDVERKATAKYCRGKGIDVGCGSKKTVPSAIGVDLTPKGHYGFAGSQLFEQSQADVTASGDDLPFADGELDYVVARHNFEHYTDPVKTLQEWHRVLRPGGRMVILVPDDEYMDTIHLDPSHYHVYTKDSLRRLVDAIGGWRVERVEQVIPKWSFILVAKKK